MKERCQRRVGKAGNIREGGKVVYSRGSRKRDDVAAESANPSNAQLGDRDALTIRYIRQSFHELEILTDILCS